MRGRNDGCNGGFFDKGFEAFVVERVACPSGHVWRASKMVGII